MEQEFGSLHLKLYKFRFHFSVFQRDDKYCPAILYLIILEKEILKNILNKSTKDYFSCTVDMCLIPLISENYLCMLKEVYNLSLNFKPFLKTLFESLTRVATSFSPTLMFKHFQGDCTYFKNLKSQKHVTLAKFNKRQPQMECKISFRSFCNHFNGKTAAWG